MCWTCSSRKHNNTHMQHERNPLVSGHLRDLGENCRKILKFSERKQDKESAICICFIKQRDLFMVLCSCVCIIATIRSPVSTQLTVH
jgi:hypothetical protein